ncbi:MAG: replicative DNA helicase [Bacteroidota bacterium]
MEEQENFNNNSLRKRVKKTTATQILADQGKLPPQAPDLEEAVLGALLIEKDALTAVVDKLKPECFYKESHQRIYASILRLFALSEPVDILTVTNDLRKSGELEIAGGAYAITQLTNRVASSAHIEFHASIIIQKYIQRELIRISSEVIRDAYDETTDVLELLDKAEKNLLGVSETNLRRSYDDISILLNKAIEQIEAATKMEGHLSAHSVPSGFVELDRVTAGWQKSDLIILAARPGMGKTAFVLSMARNMAVDYKRPIAIFSLEMSAIQLVTRLISAETELPSEKLRKGQLEDHEWVQLHEKMAALSDAPIFIDDTPALTIFELRAKCRRLKQQKGINLVVIDYLQLMSAGLDNRGGGNREQEISSISRALKSLAKELEIPIIALSQLSRAVETRAGSSRRPILSDLRESGAIEQDADIVAFIYRPEYYKINADEQGKSTEGLAELILAKHRNGALKDIPLRFIERFAKFENADPADLALYSSGSADNYSEPQTKTFGSKMNDKDDDDVF